MDKPLVCPLEGVLGTISHKWAILVVNSIGNAGKARFTALLEGLTGINPKTLTQRLRELERGGLLARNAFPEVPPRVEYNLTRKGRELQYALVPLMQWANRYDPHPHPATTPCHHAFEQLMEA